MVTPFDADGGVDYAQAGRLAKALVASGSDGLVVTGTTGENPSLFHEENFRLWSEVKQAVGDTATVIAGSGTNGTAESVKLSRDAERAGADALLQVVPYYNKPTPEGLYQHFKALSEATPLPNILYNVPSRTITNMTPETTLRLSELGNVIGIKEACDDMAQVAQIATGAPDGFRIWSGNDSDTFPAMCVGAYGVVSVASHLIGGQIKRMIELAAAGNLDGAASEHRRMLPLFKGLFVITSPIPIKYCLNHAGFPVGSLRLPLVDADPKTASFLDDLLARYEIDLPTTVVA
jgi:4-hydroxy-tetrahydrodipicolinate synthase